MGSSLPSPASAGLMGTGLPAPASASQEALASTASSSQKAVSSASGSRQSRRQEPDSDEEDRGMLALRNVGAAVSKEAKKSASGSAASTAETGDVEAGKPAESANVETAVKKRCHLHMKPNPSCKVCRRIKDENAALDVGEQSSRSTAKDTLDKEEGVKRDREKDEAKASRTFKSSPMLKDQILKSSYFKSLLDINTVEGLMEEIQQYADTLAVYNQGGGSPTIPSCFICQVYRLFTLPNAEEDLQIIVNTDSPFVRCVGFVYVRFVFEPTQFWGMLEEHLFDDMELNYLDASGKSISTSIGEYVESLLIKEKYFGTPLPRIPVKVRTQLEERLAPLPSYRKRMQANRWVFNNKDRTEDVPVEVCLENGDWVSGKALETYGRSTTFVKLRVKLEDGKEITAHLGKVVLRDTSPERSASEASEKGRSDSEGAARNRRKKHRRSRSRSRRRQGRSPDWSRWKGKSHVEMLEELRERAKEDAVSHGKVYPRRPMTFESFATSYQASENKLVSDAHVAQQRAPAQKQEETHEDDITRRLRRQQEDERQRQQAAIFEKYGKQNRPDSSSAYSDVDRADVLRLG